MVYTETSTYGYITGDELEEYHIYTYDSVDARYTEAVVMAKVSHAERIVRGLTKVTTATDGTKSMVLELSRYLMDLQIRADHPEIAVPEVDNSLLMKIFGPLTLMDVESYSPAGTVPMSGID